MVRYSMVHTGPKTHSGGLNTGLFNDIYHVSMSVNSPPKAGRKPRAIKKTIFSTFIRFLCFWLLFAMSFELSAMLAPRALLNREPSGCSTGVEFPP